MWRLYTKMKLLMSAIVSSGVFNSKTSTCDLSPIQARIYYLFIYGYVTEPAEIHFFWIRFSHLTSIRIRMRI